MDSIEDKLSVLENLAQNQAVEKQETFNEAILEINENSQNKGNFEPKMTQEQANAIVEVAKDTKAFVGVKLSQKANELIETDDTIKEEFTALAKDTVKQSIQTFDTENKKQNKKNFYELNERDVLSLGGDKSSTKGQQFSIVMIKRFFWILFMSTLGTLFIAPMCVIIELFQGISFKNIEKEEYLNGEDKKTRWIVKRHKLGKTGTVVGWIVGVVFWLTESFLIVKFPLVFLVCSIVVFVILFFINLGFGINFRKFKKKVSKYNEKNTNAIEVEIED